MHPPATLVITNAKVWTVDPQQPRAEAVAIVGDRIALVGTNAAVGSAPWVGKETPVIDAQGATVLPGFIDSHVHFSSGGYELAGVQLRDAASREEFVRRIGDFVRKIPKGEWIRGGLWDHEMWGGELPTRQWIDAVTPGNPVFISRYDSHMALANSLALRLAKVTRDTHDPDGGTIVRDVGGEPTGLMKDAAMRLVFDVVPPRSEEEHLRAVRAAMAEARRFGVTGIEDISSPKDVRLYQKLLRQAELTLRIYCITPIQQWENPARAGLSAAFGGDWLRVGAVKGFADGSLGSTTAYFFAPYNDAPNTSGLPNEMMFPEGNMLKMALGADRAGLQLAVHAIGDRANRIVLDIYAEVLKQNGSRPGRRWRIEHAQHVRPEDFDDFARLGVIASVQPYHAIDDSRWAEKRIGHERAKTTYAFRTFLDRDVRLAFGTDWTVAPINPLLTIYAAVTRASLDGSHPDGWFPEQKMTLAESIEAYTMGSAYAEFRENELGSLTPGKFADIVILDRDIFAIPPAELSNVAVRTTIVGGKIVYESRSE